MARREGGMARREEGRSVLTIRLFGQVRVEVDGEAWPLRAPAKAVEALAYLATHHGVAVARDFLATLLWPDDEPEDGRAKLRRNLHVLAQALPQPAAGEPYLLTTKQTVGWNPEAASIDVIAFTEAGVAGRLDEAATWYGGDFLEGYHDDWVLVERERLRGLQLDHLRKSVQRKRGERDLAGALADVGRILGIDPWREDALRIEMLLRSQLGDRSGALAAYRGFAARLRAELDVEPTPETQAAFDLLARGDAPADETAGATRAAAATMREPIALPFVGRQAEFDALSRAWASAAHGKGSMVLLSGEAGAGKSRLGQELALHAEGQGGLVLLGTTTPGEARPYEAAVDALRSVLPLVVPAHSPAELGVLARVLPEIAARAPIVEAQTVSPEAERMRLFEAICGALVTLSRRHPVLVVLEDLHWATASSAALVEYLARRSATLPVLIVATCRDEEVGRTHPLRGLRRRLEREGTLERIVLSRFDKTAVSEIVRRVFADRTDLETLAEELYAYSEGVPLFLDEGVHARERSPAGPRLNVPARIARLAEPARTLLESAAVLGAGFTVELLCEVAGWDEPEILRTLDELVEARFVRQGRRRSFGDYAFSHHLVHAAVYASITEADRRRRHALAAHASTSLYPDRPDRAGEIALHYDRAGDAPQAARAYAAAAAHALELYAGDEALGHAERALELGVEPELAVDLQMLRVWVSIYTGRPALRKDAVRELAMLESTAQQLPKIERLRAIDATFDERMDDARAAAQRSLQAALTVRDEAGIVQAHIELSTIAITSDRFREAEAHLERAERALPADDDAARLRLMRAQTYLAQQRGATGSDVAAAARRLLLEARRAGDQHSEAEAHNRLGHLAMAEQRFVEAREHFAAGSEAYRRLGRRELDGVELNAANLAAWMGDYDEARMLYSRCLRFKEDDNALPKVGLSVGLALIDIYTGNLARAETIVERVAPRCRGMGTLDEANAHLCLALIAAERGNAGTARGEFEAALAIHRSKPAGRLFAVTLAFAALAALDAGENDRASALDAELGGLPDELLRGEEFPHLMLWARSRVAELLGDEARAEVAMRAAQSLYDARLEAIGPKGASAYAAVPWNARFLADWAERSRAARYAQQPS